MAYDIGTARGIIQMDYNGRGIAQARSDVDQLTSSTGKVNKVMGLAGKIGPLSGLSIAAAFGFAVKTLADFEKQISGIEAVSGATGDEIDALRDKALQLGADTAFTATEAASAMEELVKAGISVDDVLNGAADAAVALAAAGGIGIPEAATIASNAMNQFGLTAGELPGVVDSIAGAANASAIDVGQLGQSLSQAGAVANLAGLTFEDTATAIALMGNAGIVGSDAGTSLKTMLQNLQPTTAKQKELFEELGLVTEDGANKFFDAEGTVKSYAQVAGILGKALEGQGNQQKLLNLETLFGTDAIRAAAVAADAGRQGVNALNKEMSETTAAEVAAARMDNFRGSLDQLGGSLETALIKGGSGGLVVLRKVIDVLTQGVNAGVDMAEVLAGRLEPGFRDVVEVVGNVVSGIAAAVDVVDGLVLSIAGLGLGAVIFLFQTLASVLSVVTGALEGQGAVVAIVAGTWLLLANGGIGVVIARLGWFVAYAVVQTLAGLGALTAGAATTSVALAALAAAAATAAASLGAVALLVAAVMVWNAYKEAVEETDAALRAAADAKATGNFAGMQTEIDSLNELIAARKAALEEYGVDSIEDTGKFLNNAFNPTRWGDIAKLGEFGDSLGALEASSADLTDTLDTMGTGISDLAVKLGLLDPSQAEDLIDAFAEGDPEALAEMDGLLTQMQPLLDEAGVSATEFMNALKGEGDTSLPEIEAALDRVTSKSGRAKNATQSLADAAAGFADKAQTAADAAAGLEDALDSLIGVELSVSEASIAWREALRSLRNELKDTGGAIFDNSKVGDANKEVVISTTQSLLDKVAAEAKAGTSLGDLTKMLKEGRNGMIDAAVAAGANKDEITELLAQYKLTPKTIKTLVQQEGVNRANKAINDLTKKYQLTPEEVKTVFEAAGADTAAEKVKALRDYIKQLKDKDAFIDTPGSDKSIEQIKELRAQIKELLGKDAKIGTPGAVESANEVQRLRDQIALLKDKDITITTYVRRVVGDIAAGIGDTFGGGGPSGGNPTPRTSPRAVDDGMDGKTVIEAPPMPIQVAPSGRSTSGSGALRLSSGALKIVNGVAYVSGIAEVIDDNGDDYDDTLERMNR